VAVEDWQNEQLPVQIVATNIPPEQLMVWFALHF